MATWSDAFSGRTTYSLELVLTETSTNASANTSTVTGTLQFNPPSNASGWNGFLSQNFYSFTFNGTTYTGNFTWDFRTSQATKVLKTVTATITHAANGTGSVSASGSATIDSNDTASISTKTLTLTDFVRVPSAPASPTVTRSGDGLTLTVTSAVASSAVSITDYDARWQASGGAWTTISLGTDRTGNITVPSATTTYFVQTRAVSSEGDGAWSSSASVVGIPSAPASISATRDGRTVTVIAGTASGSGVTSYSVQYSSNGGSSWSSAVAMSSQSYTYTTLTAGQTYLFRVYATNSIGNSASTTSDEVFVPAGGKRWTGSAWTASTIGRRWTGSAWVDLTTAKRWNGSAWTDLT